MVVNPQRVCRATKCRKGKFGDEIHRAFDSLRIKIDNNHNNHNTKVSMFLVESCMFLNEPFIF